VLPAGLAKIPLAPSGLALSASLVAAGGAVETAGRRSFVSGCSQAPRPEEGGAGELLDAGTEGRHGAKLELPSLGRRSMPAAGRGGSAGWLVSQDGDGLSACHPLEWTATRRRVRRVQL
jgi:hypothetical protein